MRGSSYILVDGVPVEEPDLHKWSQWYEKVSKRGERILAKWSEGEVKVTTVFLGFDHGLEEEGPPLVFGTLISGGPHDGSEWNYATLDDALHGHKHAVAFAKGEEFGPREWSPRKGKCFCEEIHPDERRAGSGEERPRLGRVDGTQG